MIYHSTQSDDYLWYLILRGKQKEKTTTHPNTQKTNLVYTNTPEYTKTKNQNKKNNLVDGSILVLVDNKAPVIEAISLKEIDYA